MTKEEQLMVFELYKAHFSAKEVEKVFPYCYGTIQNLYRGFIAARIEKYDRINLITGENINGRIKELSALNSQQSGINKEYPEELPKTSTQ